MRFIATLALSALLALPAAARPLAPDEAKELGKSVDIYLRSIGRSEAERVVSAIPPRVLNVFAGKAGIEAGELIPTLAEQMKTLMKTAKFSDFYSDKSSLDAQDATLADGTVVTWVLVPTAFTAETAAGKTRNEQPLLVLKEGKKWYMMRIEGDAQRQLVGFAYPFLNDVEIPASRSTPLN